MSNYIDGTRNELLSDGDLRMVFLSNHKLGYAAMTKLGLIKLACMETQDLLVSFKISRLADGIPFMAIQE